MTSRQRVSRADFNTMKNDASRSLIEDRCCAAASLLPKAFTHRSPPKIAAARSSRVNISCAVMLNMMVDDIDIEQKPEASGVALRNSVYDAS